MTQPSRRTTTRWVITSVVGLCVLLMVTGGAAGSGVGGAFFMAGLVALLLGVGALAVGHARWAFIATRRIGFFVAVAGLVAAIAGGATMPTIKSTPASDSSTAATATTTPKPSPKASPTHTAPPTPNEQAIGQLTPRRTEPVAPPTMRPPGSFPTLPRTKR